MYAGVSTACLYPRVVEDALYDLALAGVSRVEIFINSHSELRRNFVDAMAQLMRRFEMTCCSLHPYTCAFSGWQIWGNPTVLLWRRKMWHGAPAHP